MPDRIDADEGGSLTLTCEITGSVSSVTWFKGDQVLTNSVQIETKQPVYEKGNLIVRSTFTIDAIKKEDADTYKCRASQAFDDTVFGEAKSEVAVKGNE